MQAEQLSAQLCKKAAQSAAVRNHRFQKFEEKYVLTSTQFPNPSAGADYAALEDVHEGLTYIVRPGVSFVPPEWLSAVMWLLRGDSYIRMVNSWPPTAGTTAPALKFTFDAEFQRLPQKQRRRFRHSVQMLLHPDKVSTFANEFCRTLASKMHTEVFAQMDKLEEGLMSAW